MKLPSRDQYAHMIRIPVRWGDVDMLGHVNNARYFTYVESARINYFEQVLGDDSGSWSDGGVILARIDCDFISQVRYPADIDVGTRVTRLGRSSIVVEHGMFVAENAVARSEAIVVWFDYQAQKTAPTPDHVRQFIIDREREAPEEN